MTTKVLSSRPRINAVRPMTTPGNMSPYYCTAQIFRAINFADFTVTLPNTVSVLVNWILNKCGSITQNKVVWILYAVLNAVVVCS